MFFFCLSISVLQFLISIVLYYAVSGNRNEKLKVIMNSNVTVSNNCADGANSSPNGNPHTHGLHNQYGHDRDGDQQCNSLHIPSEKDTMTNSPPQLLYDSHQYERDCGSEAQNYHTDANTTKTKSKKQLNRFKRKEAKAKSILQKHEDKNVKLSDTPTKVSYTLHLATHS